MGFIQPYDIAVLVLGLTGFLFLMQLIVVDIVALKKKHTPGYPIESDHNDMLFRAARALANSNESAAIFMLLVAFSILSSADPSWLNVACVVYFLGRLGHMLCYYANAKLWRSISFSISLLGLVAIFVIGIAAWL